MEVDKESSVVSEVALNREIVDGGKIHEELKITIPTNPNHSDSDCQSTVSNQDIKMEKVDPDCLSTPATIQETILKNGAEMKPDAPNAVESKNYLPSGGEDVENVVPAKKVKRPQVKDLI